MSTIDYDNYARIMKAIAHPTRLKILNLMRKECPCVKQMETVADASQPNISQHLSLLRNLGIVEAEREGNLHCYQIKDQNVRIILDTLFR